MDTDEALIELKLMLDLNPSDPPEAIVRAVQLLNDIVDTIIADDGHAEDDRTP